MFTGTMFRQAIFAIGLGERRFDCERERNRDCPKSLPTNYSTNYLACLIITGGPKISFSPLRLQVHTFGGESAF
jgi:hypothetical protein